MYLWMSERYFNSQPHEEADSSCKRTWVRNRISTHSLTKRLTTSNIRSTSLMIISTHSLTKRLTLSTRRTLFPFVISTHSLTKRLTSYSRSPQYPIPFQLTASRRGWRDVTTTWDFDAIISTHSLTKRLTEIQRKHPLISFHFNSQPHEEADGLMANLLTLQMNFNSQPHEEADTTHLYAPPFLNHFNSQPHEEADFKC